MSLFSESIVFLWLLPVAAQIVLPLAMLVVWIAQRATGTAFSKKPALPMTGGENLAQKAA